MSTAWTSSPSGTGSELLVEVKGWPSTTYAKGERAGQPKPTQPTLQATHWFAEGLTTLIRRGAEPEVAARAGITGQAEVPDPARRGGLGAGAAGHHGLPGHRRRGGAEWEREN